VSESEHNTQMLINGLFGAFRCLRHRVKSALKHEPQLPGTEEKRLPPIQISKRKFPECRYLIVSEGRIFRRAFVNICWSISNSIRSPMIPVSLLHSRCLWPEGGGAKTFPHPFDYWSNDWLNDWLNEGLNDWISDWCNEWFNKWLNEWPNESLNEWLNDWVAERFTERRNEWLNDWFDESLNERSKKWFNEWLGECFRAWFNEWFIMRGNEWMDSWMNDLGNGSMNE
jgi:hypothetical protein